MGTFYPYNNTVFAPSPPVCPKVQVSSAAIYEMGRMCKGLGIVVDFLSESADVPLKAFNELSTTVRPVVPIVSAVQAAPIDSTDVRRAKAAEAARARRARERAVSQSTKVVLNGSEESCSSVGGSV